MLLFQYPRREALWRVAREHRHFPLQYDLTCVEVLINIMHGTARDRFTGCDHTFMDVEPGILWQQARMDVQNAVWESGYEGRRQQPHVPGEADQIHVASL